MSAELTVACLGAGYFAQFHHDAWRRIPRTRLIAVADRDEAKARAAGAAAYGSLDAMLEAKVPDILDVVVPPPGHLDAIRAGLAAGVKAIVCQKPFCRGMDEAREAVRLAREAGVPLIVHENFRFQPWYRAIRDEIASGAVGKVHLATFRLRTGDGQGPRAYLDRQPYFQTMPRLLVHETAVHWIDTFRFLLGPIRDVYADLRRMNPVISGEDAGHVLFGFDEGVRALFDGDRLLDHDAEDRRTTLGEGLVEGDGGELRLNGDGSVRSRRFGSREWRTVLRPEKRPGFGGDCVGALQRHVVSALLDGGELENAAEDYLPVLAVEEAIYRSAAEERKVRL